MQSERVSMRPIRAVARLLAGMGLLGFGLSGCGSFEPVTTYQQITDPAQLYATLGINQRAINMSTMAPYDTLQLRATPYNVKGEAMPGLPNPVFTLLNINDTSMVTVTPDGLVTAHASTEFSDYGYIGIVATLSVTGNASHADTTYVSVISGQPPEVATFSQHPVPPDSASLGMTVAFGSFAIGNFNLLNVLYADNIFNTRIPLVQVLDGDGNPLSLLIEYRTLDPDIVQTSDGIYTITTTDFRTRLSGAAPGVGRVVAQMTAFGTAKADTVPFTITLPVLQFVDAVSGLDDGPSVFSPAEIRLAPYGMVFWQSLADDSVDVTFDDPTNVGDAPTDVCDVINGDPASYGAGPACGSGNFIIPSLVKDDNGQYPAMSTRVRQFRVPGVYTYHSTRTGAIGRVIVTDNPDPSALP